MEWTQLGSVAYVKNGFSPNKTSQSRQRWARPTSKCAALLYGSADTFSDSLAQSFQTLWSIIASCAKMSAQTGL